jgi:hypothetical protein
MPIDLSRLKDLLAGVPVFYQTGTQNFVKGDRLKFENEEARERAKRTIKHFVNRGFNV